MDQRANERTVWMNGAFIPESQALVPYRDRSSLFGDGAFDLTRTFQGRIFKLDEHIDRLYRSLKALHLDATMEPGKMREITHEVVDRNRHLLGEIDDFWVGQRLSRGVLKVDGDNWDHYGPTVIVECSPIPIADRAILLDMAGISEQLFESAYNLIDSLIAMLRQKRKYLRDAQFTHPRGCGRSQKWGCPANTLDMLKLCSLSKAGLNLKRETSLNPLKIVCSFRGA